VVLKDFYCSDCKIKFEELVSSDEVFAKCPLCGKIARRVFLKAPVVSLFRSGYYESLDAYFDDATQLREFCKRNNISPCVKLTKREV